jgi:hypothetical protein
MKNIKILLFKTIKAFKIIKYRYLKNNKYNKIKTILYQYKISKYISINFKSLMN